MNRPNPLLIGSFVLGALALLVMGVLVLGSDRWLSSADRFTIHFDETLKGLRIGAPVAYRGVEIGEVETITAILDPATSELRVPVTVRLRNDALLLDGGGEPTPATMAALVERGLRAQLQLESLVTGRLFVGLDFFPAQPAHYREEDAQLPEIPSVRSPLAGLSRSVDELTMTAPRLLEEASGLLTDLRAMLSGQDGRTLRDGVDAAAGLLVALEREDGPLRRALDELPATLAALHGAASGLGILVARLDAAADARVEQLGELMAEFTRTAASVRRAADQANAMLAQNRGDIRDFTERGLPELTGLIEDATRMVNEFNGLARDLRQDPARFFFGNRSGEGVRLPR